MMLRIIGVSFIEWIDLLREESLGAKALGV